MLLGIEFKVGVDFMDHVSEGAGESSEEKHNSDHGEAHCDSELVGRGGRMLLLSPA